jgi:hypothetical protein
MTRTTLSSLIALLVSLALVGCEDDGSPCPCGGLTVELLDHLNRGCARAGDTTLQCDGRAAVNGFDYRGDTLTLDIHFEANCCPAFTEEVSLTDRTLSISVVDTLHGCRCTCPYDNLFTFLLSGGDELRILFTSSTAPGGACASGLDTVITLSGR